MKKTFRKHVLPSMITFLVTGIYVSIDGFFIGRAVGDIGIASINMAWPLAAAILAAGTSIGLGGAVNVSLLKGEGNKKKGRAMLGNIIILLLFASVFITVLLLLVSKPLLRLLGASGELLELSHGYIRVLAFGAILQVFGAGITPLLRNQNKTWIAMVLMVGNFVIDTVLSGVFVMVLGLGVTGAAAATLIGQGVALVPALIIFVQSEKEALREIRLGFAEMLTIVKSGLPIFGLSFIPSVTTMVMNRQAVYYGGETALAAFAVSAYVISIGQLLAQGIGEGCQPLISYYFGAKIFATVKQLRKWTYSLGFIVNLIVMVGIVLLRRQIPILFGVSAQVANILQVTLPLCAISLPLYAFTRVSSEYFNAVKNSRYSSMIIYGEALVFLPIFSILLPKFLSLNGVWLIAFAVQLFVSIVVVFLLRKAKQGLQKVGKQV